MALDINDIVQVRSSIAAAGSLQRDFGRTLLLVENAQELSAGGAGSVRAFASLTDVTNSGIPSTSEIYRAAQVYFSQSPYPKNLVVANWPKVAQVSRSQGRAVNASAADFAGAGSAGSFRFNGVDVSGVNFAADTTLAAVAATLETAIRALDGLTNVDVVFEGGAFHVETDSSGTRFAEGGRIGAHSQGSGVDVSRYTGLTDPLYYSAGGPAQELEAYLTEAAEENPDWYFITMQSSYISDYPMIEAVSAWAEANKRFLVAQVNDTGAITAAGFGDLEDLLETDRSRTAVVWSATQDYKAVSVAARLSSTNFNARNSLPTLMFKSLPGVVADDITSVQKRYLDDSRVNSYVPFAGQNILTEGWAVRDGVWMDSRFWLDWFDWKLQTEIFALFRSNTTRIPQTQEGIALLRNTIIEVCESGVRNGGIAAGNVSSALAGDISQTTENPDFDGDLSRGYLVHIDSLALQTLSDREARKAPPIKIWLKGSGALHSAEITITFEN